MVTRIRTARGVRLVSKPLESIEFQALIQRDESPRLELAIPRRLGHQTFNVVCNSLIAFREECAREIKKFRKRK